MRKYIHILLMTIGLVATAVTLYIEDFHWFTLFFFITVPMTALIIGSLMTIFPKEQYGDGLDEHGAMIFPWALNIFICVMLLKQSIKEIQVIFN